MQVFQLRKDILVSVVTTARDVAVSGNEMVLRVELVEQTTSEA
jgi:hypothetical protein